jgi:hypothetical protein
VYSIASYVFNIYTDWRNMAKMLRIGDKGWQFIEGNIIFRRAAIEVDENCPDMYKQIIATCADKGWIRPVAYLPQEEEFLQTISGVIPK